MNLRISLSREATGREINECLKKIGYLHSENRITPDGEDGWIMATEIDTLHDAQPQLVLEKLKELPTVRQAEIR